MMPQVGVFEIVIVLVIALLVFGPKRLPELGKSLGRGITEFKDGLQNIGDDDDDDDEDEDDTSEAEIATIESAHPEEDLPLPGEEPEVVEVVQDTAPSDEAEPVDAEVLRDKQD